MKTKQTILPENPEVFEQLQQLVVERLKALPSDAELSVGDLSYAKGDLMTHVKQNDSLGKEIMEMQLEFLQELTDGSIYDDEQHSSSDQTKSR